MKTSLILFALAAFMVLPAGVSADNQGHNQKIGFWQDPQGQRRHKARPRVDLVIALDTSGSMSGLINSARQKLWDIINEVARVKPTPLLRVGLVTFGSGGSEGNGYVKIQSDLTRDLDTINDKLFRLSTSGGTEYVGRVVYRATRELSWHRGGNTLRQIFVAGNESADQDRKVTVVQALRQAKRRGIFVNAIYCGSNGSSDAMSWRRVAQRGQGMYAAIDHNHGTVAISTPYDAKLNALSAKLNRTYIAYGARGRAAAANQVAQDKNAKKVHASTGASRALAKVSGVYQNDDWDLVDARRSGKLRWVKKKALPQRLRKMDQEELERYVEGKSKERRQIRAEIVKLSKQRKVHIKVEMKKRGTSGDRAFETAVKEALRQQAAKKKIVLK